MFKANIHLKTADKDGYFGISCDMHVENADAHDKMMLMHVLARALEMSTFDILLFVLAESQEYFDGEETTESLETSQSEEPEDA